MCLSHSRAFHSQITDGNADPCIFRVFGLSFMVGQMFFQLGLADE